MRLDMLIVFQHSKSESYFDYERGKLAEARGGEGEVLCVICKLYLYTVLCLRHEVLCLNVVPERHLLAIRVLS